MRIRRSASRLLGSAYSASAAPPVAAAPPFDLLLPPPPPPQHLAPCSAPESCGGASFSAPSASSAEPCELSRSPWDLIAELSLSDPQVEDDIVDKYFVHVTTRSSWLFSATMPAASSKQKNLQAAAGEGSTKLRRGTVKKPAAEGSTKLRREAAKKPAIVSKGKEGDTNKKAKVKKEEGENVGARVWQCKKNDGKRWHCNRPVSQPDTLCEYHFVQRRTYWNPDLEYLSMAELEKAAPAPVPVPAAASKSATRSKPRRKKPGSDVSATEGFYYYTGFGLFRSKRQCRSGGMNMNGPVPAKQEEEDDHVKDDASPSQQAEVDEGHDDDTNQTATAAHGDASSCEDDIAGIAGVDEGSSDDYFDGVGISGHRMNGNSDPKACNADGKRKVPWKRWRKRVKARSLKSLM